MPLSIMMAFMAFVVMVMAVMVMALMPIDHHVGGIGQCVCAGAAVNYGLETGQSAHAIRGRVIGYVESENVVTIAALDRTVEASGAARVDGDIGRDRVIAIPTF